MTRNEERGITSLQLSLVKAKQLMTTKWCERSGQQEEPPEAALPMPATAQAGGMPTRPMPPPPTKPPSTAAPKPPPSIISMSSSCSSTWNVATPQTDGLDQRHDAATSQQPLMRVQVLEAKVRSLEGEVEYLKNQFRNLMDIMCAHDFQVLPTVAMRDGLFAENEVPPFADATE